MSSYQTHWDLNAGPSACEADVIPLHHRPNYNHKFVKIKMLSCFAYINLGFVLQPKC